METGKLTSKGQITIPKKIREFLKIQKNAEIVFLPVESGKVLMTTRQLPAEGLFGLLKHRKQAKPVSQDEIDSLIRKKRIQRSVK